MFSKVADLTTGGSLIAAIDRLLISGGGLLMAIDEAAAIQERVDRLWEAMTVEERRNYDRREDEVIAILTFVRPLIETHEACREREEQLVANMTKLWVWILFAVAVAAYGLDFKVLAWTIAVLPLLVLLGGPVEAYFLIRRREQLHEQLQEQRYRWIEMSASSYSFNNYFNVVRGSAKDEKGAREYERVWWARLREELVENGRGGLNRYAG
jgi:hypothetical protein